MEPSFFTLFKRGKYFTTPSVDWKDLDLNERKERREAERFAVAAIAFCSKHDERFQRHFLKTICGSDPTSFGQTVDTRVEDKRWGDLVFVSRDPPLVHVVECKINAPLEEFQNPEKDIFWDSGYGAEIRDAFGLCEINYIVLGYRPALQLPNKKRGIQCFQKRWKDLELGYPLQSNLALDLYDSLARLGISRFRVRKTRQLKVGRRAQVGSEAYGLLYGAFTELDVALGKLELSIEYPDENSWYFGIDLKKSDRAGEQKTPQGQLQKLVCSTSRYLLWLGYHQGDREDDVVFSVWFYCGSAPAENAITRKVGKQLHKLKAKIVRHGVEGTDHNEIEVQARAADVAELDLEGDQQWFVRAVEFIM